MQYTQGFPVTYFLTWPRCSRRSTWTCNLIELT